MSPAPDPPSLDALAERVADGDRVDWEDCEARATLPEVRRLVGAFRLIEQVARAHATAGEARPTAPLPLGERWGRLEVIERLGEGGFAEVYRARDPLLDREVALKLLLPRRDRGESAQQEILREGRLLARVKHPNVVTVHGADRIEGRIGIWTELVEGETLARLVAREGVLAAEEAALVGARLSGALAALHAAGLVHRDVKAQNVMREKGGRVVLMDFGIARDLDEPVDGETPLRGTPIYMAPEVMAGEPASPRSDLYSLGVLLYHLVTGSFPARPRVPDAAPVEAASVSRGLRDRHRELPEGFCAVVERALAADPAQRFASAGEMGRALGALLARGAFATVTPAAAAAPRARSHRGRNAAVGAAALVSVALALWTLGAKAAPPPATVARLAVAPFVNASDDPGQDYLARAVPIELIARLGQVGELTVVPWSFTRRYLEQPRSVTDFAAASGADAVVEGAVQLVPSTADGSRVSVSVNVFARDGALLWSLQTQGRMGEFLAMQEQLARELAVRLRARIARRGALAADTRAANPEAMECYLRGEEALEFRTPSGLFAAADHFRDAIDTDPAFVEAHVGLAQAIALLNVYTGLPSSEEALRTVLDSTRRALELNPTSGRAWAVRAFAHYAFAWDWETAGAEFRKALAFEPNSPLANHWYADYLSALGRHDEALKHIRLAAERSPHSPILGRDVAWVYFFARRYDEAIAQLRQTLAVEPGFPPAHTLLARAYVMKRRDREALEEFSRVGGYLVMRAQALAAAGRGDEARALLRTLDAAPPGDEVDTPYLRALVLAALGETDAAFARLEEAAAVRDTALLALFTDPMLDGLRGDARFSRLVARMGFPHRNPAAD